MSRAGVVTLAPDGTSDRRWLGTIGHVSGLQWGSTMPGGDDQMSCTVELPRLYREPALAPGRIVQVWGGPGLLYEGRLDRPSPAADGWSLTAHGSGSFGDDYVAIWSSYTATDILTQAIGRGLRWSIGNVGGGNLSQVSDSASQSVTSFLNAYTNTVSMTWFVDQLGWPGGAVINCFSIPTAVTRLLVTTVPAAPDLVAYINALYVRYQTSPDAGSAAATYGLTSSTLPSSITAHGRTEDYWDISSSGQLSTGAAQSAAAGALAKYVSASFSTQFTATHGHYLTTRGAAVDLAAERAGEVVQLILAAGGFGGELGPVWPITFPVGAVAYSEDSQELTITPYQSVRANFAGLLGLIAPHKKPPRKPPPRHHLHIPHHVPARHR